MPTTFGTSTRTLVASTACGPAPQFRVQVLPQGESVWRLFATYKKSDVANECIKHLQAEGMTARIVSIRICPTAG